MPLPPAAAAYYAVCRQLRTVPNPSFLTALAQFPPRLPSFCATAVTSDLHAVALCSSLLIAHAVPWSHVSRFVTIFAPEHGPTDLSATALTVLSNLPHPVAPASTASDPTPPPSINLLTDPSVCEDPTESSGTLVVDFSNSPGITPRGAAAILTACLIIPQKARHIQLELHLCHCPGVHTIDLQPWHSLLDHERNNHMSPNACLTGLALDGCPLRGLPSFTVRKLSHLRWISMRATRVRNFWRLADIVSSLPLLAAALFAGDATRANDLQSLGRIGRLRPNSNNSNNLLLNSSSLPRNRDEENDINLQYANDLGDHVHEWMSHALRTIPGFTSTNACIQHTPATTLSHFRDFVIAARPTKSPLLWLDGGVVSARERQWARDAVTAKFERAPYAGNLHRNSRIVSLLRDRELGRAPCPFGRNKARQRKKLGISNCSPSTDNIQEERGRLESEMDCLPRHERGSSGRPKKRIRNVNITQQKYGRPIDPALLGSVLDGPDSDAIMNASGAFNIDSLTPSQEITADLAAVADAAGVSHVILPLLSSPCGGSSQWTDGLRRKNHGNSIRLRALDEHRREGVFEHCMNKTLVRRRGCAKVSYWKQGNERPRQLEYNPGKDGEIVYATANRMLVVADEESGDVIASCRVGGGPGWRGSRGIGYSADCNPETSRIAKTYDLGEAIRDNAGGGLAAADNMLAGEGQTSVFGLAWLNKRPDMFVCGEYGGLIHMYNVGWMQDQTNGGCVYACEQFDELTSISVSADDSRFAVSGSKHDVGIFDISTGTRIETMSACHGGLINVIKFGNTNPNILLTSSFDGFVRKWDLRDRHADGSRRPIFTSRTPVDTMMACFSPDDQWFLASAVDNEVGQYSAIDGRLALQLDIARTGNRYNFTRSYYMNDGNYIVSGSCMESVVRVHNSRGSGALLTEVDVDERGDVNMLNHHGQHAGVGFDVGVGRTDQGVGGGNNSAMCVQSLRASPWRPFNVSALLVTTDQTVDELIAHIDLRTR